MYIIADIRIVCYLKKYILHLPYGQLGDAPALLSAEYEQEVDGWKLKWLYMDNKTESTANKQKMDILKCVTAVTSCCLPYLVDLILYFSPFLSLSLHFLKKQRLDSFQVGHTGLTAPPCGCSAGLHLLSVTSISAVIHCFSAASPA